MCCESLRRLIPDTANLRGVEAKNMHIFSCMVFDVISMQLTWRVENWLPKRHSVLSFKI